MQCFRNVFGIVKLLTVGAILFQLTVVNGSSRKLSLVSSYNANDPGFFKEFNDLVAEYKPLNLGMGVPDFNPPKILQSALADAATSSNYTLSQYSPFRGHLRLLKALATLFSKLINLTLDPNENVVATAGATGAMFAALTAHTMPGDEWILFTPSYTPFLSAIRAVRGVPRTIPLVANKTTGKITSANFKFNKENLAKLFNKKTKGVLLNTPHNPTGKIFDYEELAYIAELAKKWDVLVVVDEIYQFMIYNKAKHVRIATLPGMFERTITIGSTSKMFAATGYRIGWAFGPKDLITNVMTASAIMIDTVPTPNQEAIGVFLERETENYGKPDSLIKQMQREYGDKATRVYDILTKFGMTPVSAESGYFITANWTTMISKDEVDKKVNEYMDYSFVKWLIKNVKLYGYPMSPFYGDDVTPREQDYIRITMIKSDKTIGELDRLMKKWKSTRKN